MKIERRTLALGAALATLAGGALAQTAGAPIRIGSTLALTGPLSATALIHKLVGEIYVEQLNERGGCSGARSSGSSRTTSPSPTWRARSTSSSSPPTRSTC